MRISRVQIVNFANFANLDVQTSDSLVIVGENKVGKSNFIRALQLILDPSLSERDRQLDLEDFWDGLGDGKIGAVIEIAVELTDFTDDPRLMAHLADCVVEPGPPMVARLTYRFQPKGNLGRDPETLADYEFVMFGGDDPDMGVSASIRRMLPMDVQGALRDTEKDLANWRRSPLRPLIDELTANLDDDARSQILGLVNQAQTDLKGRSEVTDTAARIGERLVKIAGNQHAVPVHLGLAPVRVDSLLRGLRILIDDGARGIGDASLGTANLIFLALKSMELDQLVVQGARDHTFFAIEEPEAHLHPHVQRLVYRYFLEGGVTPGEEDSQANVTTILTTHSPHIASVSPIRSILLLRADSAAKTTVATSAASAVLTSRDEADLQRYIDVNRGEMLFARGIILVEGDAERFLIPAFADALGMPLDILGISVCSIGGVNFAPYIRLLGPKALNIPHVLLTDLDPMPSGPPLAQARIAKLLSIVEPSVDYTSMDDASLFERAKLFGIYVNSNTLEPELFSYGLGAFMKHVIRQELGLRKDTIAAIDSWIADPATLDVGRLLGLIERIGKGRFAQGLSAHVTEAACPNYIRAALEKIRSVVS